MLQRIGFLLVLACSSCITVGDGAAWAAGRVIGLAGEPIEGALVYFEACYSAGFPDLSTDAKGEFHVSCIMRPGRFQTALVIDAPGYKPAYLSVPTLTRNHVSAVLAPLSSRESSRASLLAAPAPSPSRKPVP